MKSVKPRPDYSRTAQWEVVTENRDGQEERHVFDAVICCAGHYTYPHLPLKDFPGKHLQTEATLTGEAHTKCMFSAPEILREEEFKLNVCLLMRKREGEETRKEQVLCLFVCLKDSFAL